MMTPNLLQPGLITALTLALSTLTLSTAPAYDDFILQALLEQQPC